METNDNENTMNQNLLNVVFHYTVIRGKFIVIQPYLKKQEKQQINNLTLHQSNQKKKNKRTPKLAEENK